MKQITLFELNQRIDKAQKVKITHGDSNSFTRLGSYLTLRTGMTHDVWFIGKDLTNGLDIIELVG